MGVGTLCSIGAGVVSVRPPVLLLHSLMFILVDSPTDVYRIWSVGSVRQKIALVDASLPPQVIWSAISMDSSRRDPV
jgi:hypothetical protein